MNKNDEQPTCRILYQKDTPDFSNDLHFEMDMQSLSKKYQAACNLIMRGKKLAVVARRLKLPVELLIERLRQHFSAYQFSKN
ncbi:MAG: hypothetical protein KAV00_03645 [Phycisphaerae bacterium]|nr:hypothetical protein [Phycisphaerae bacterium]